MKNICFLYLTIILLAFSCKNSPNLSTDKINNTNNSVTDYIKKPTKTLISAHRGGSGLKNYPENALETIAFLYERDVKIFEIDVTQTIDDQLLLLHDDHLERTTNGHGSIESLTAEELSKFNLVDDYGNETTYKIPYLKDVLSWTKAHKNAYLMVDFKKNVSYEKVINLIHEIGVQNQCILISYSVEQAEKLHKLDPNILLSVSARNEKELDWLLNSNVPTENMIAFTGTRLSNEELYKKLHDLGIPTILGTLGNLDKKAATKGDNLYKKWVDLGIDILATDRPLEAQKAIQ